MIAIAGAKGGCGKTVTTIGLAEAFGRTGSATVAVDVDLQLPNLHATAGVDREPTLAALADGTDVTSIARPSPRESRVGILPAPESSAKIDVEATLSRLDTDSMRVLVDCPSGGGPDVVEPLSAASAVLVVTTPTDRSLRAATKTIDIARRLEVPIIGTVVNKCDSVPEGLAPRFDVPVVGTVPERSAPLTNETTRGAYDEIVAEILDRRSPDETRIDPASDRLPTGIEALDRPLNGGFPEGSVVALTADPASQSEQLLYRVTATRGTLYLTTERPPSSVSRAIGATDVDSGNPTVRHLSNEDPLERATELVEELPARANLVVDSVDVLERADHSAYLDFLQTLTDRIQGTNGLAILHCLTGSDEPANRTTTKHVADAVCTLRSSSPDSDGEESLSISKFRYACGATGTLETGPELASDSTPETSDPLFD